MSKFSGFRYTGEGNLFLAGVPARNITYEEAKEKGFEKKHLLASGIYEEIKEENGQGQNKKEPPVDNPKPDTKSKTEPETGGNS